MSLSFRALVVFTAHVSCLEVSQALQAEGDLMNRLLSKYEPRVRPVKNPHSSINVTLRFTMQRIDDLVRNDLRKEQLRVSGWVETQWRDEFLQWDPSSEQGIEQLIFRAEDVWLPDISVVNSLKGMFVSHDQGHSYRVPVNSEGYTRWVPPDNFAVSCDVDITFFPFDEQVCSLMFKSWHYRISEMTLVKADTVSLDMTEYEEDGEWELKQTLVELVVRRRPVFYMVNIMIPCLMLCGLVLVNFFLPPDSGEKISLGITVLLSFSVFQLLIAENVPTSSLTTPLLGVYLLCIMAASTSSITVTVLVLNLHHRTIYSHPPPWLKVFVLDYLARLVCMRRHLGHFGILPIVKEPVTGKQAAAGTAAMNTRKIKLTVEDLEGPGVQQKITVLEHDDDLETTPSESDYRHVRLVPKNLDSGNSSQRDLLKSGSVAASAACRGERGEGGLSSLNVAMPVWKCSEGDLPDNVHSTAPHSPGTSQHVLSANATRSALRLIRSIAHLDQPGNTTSTQEFVKAVRDVYHELLTARQACETEHALENEWKIIARVVDRFFFWVTFTCVV
ncbi:hypothetical protein BaRGS_00035599, partial [Batillaria attramentaria]